jgi:hypothetical protein
MSRKSRLTLRVPASLKAAVAKLAKEDGVSIDTFVACAMAEKLSALKTAEFFGQRRSRADARVFDRILKRSGGEPPRPGDELPEGYTPPKRRPSRKAA